MFLESLPLSFRPSRPAAAVLLSVAALVGCACGSSPKVPSGPPPEYEEPPAPSWLKDSGAPAPASTASEPDGGAPPTS